jgi:hypothetical protein
MSKKGEMSSIMRNGFDIDNEYAKTRSATSLEHQSHVTESLSLAHT